MQIPLTSTRLGDSIQRGSLKQGGPLPKAASGASLRGGCIGLAGHESALGDQGLSGSRPVRSRSALQSANLPTYAYMSICIYICTYILRVYIYMYIYIDIHLFRCMHIYVCTYKHTYIHTYIHSYKNTDIQTYIDTYMHAYIHAYIHTLIDIQT